MSLTLWLGWVSVVVIILAIILTLIEVDARREGSTVQARGRAQAAHRRASGWETDNRLVRRPTEKESPAATGLTNQHSSKETK